jgi:hypothetical protein
MMSYDLPAFARLPIGRRAFADWRAAGTVRARSGFPIDILARENLLGFGFDNAPRPDLVAGVPVWKGGQLNPAAFAAPGGAQGTLGRNSISGFGMFQADASLHRNFPIGEVASIEIGILALNVLNHPTLGDPVRFLNSRFFGQPVSMLSLFLGTGSPRSGLTPLFQPGGPRSLEIDVKFRF